MTKKQINKKHGISKRTDNKGHKGMRNTTYFILVYYLAHRFYLKKYKIL